MQSIKYRRANTDTNSATDNISKVLLLRTGSYTCLAFAILYPRTRNFGWCVLFSLLQIFECTKCFGSSGHLQVHNLGCRSSIAGSSLGWN
jgi:hypothetical protein